MQPTVGRIVHYVLPATEHRASEIRPAIIVRALRPTDDEGGAPGLSNLHVFPDGPNDSVLYGVPESWIGSVLYDPAGAPGTWHWPPRAGVPA